MDIIKITGAAVVLMSSFMLGMYFVVVNKTRIKNLADIDETWRTICLLYTSDAADEL